MLKEATGNAREAAKSFSENANAQLGAIKSASQGLFNISAPYMDYDRGESIKKKVRVVTNVNFFLE